MTTGEIIYDLRKKQGWSQEELAERIGVTRQAVSRWESDSAKPDADKIIALCDLFSISADSLLRGDEPEIRMQADPVSEKGRMKAGDIAAWCAIGFSAIIFFILNLLSSVNPKGVGYVKYYNLEWLVWFAGLLGLAALVRLVCKGIKKSRKICVN